MQPNKERFKWFNDARYGMFIHWGLYSLLGRGEWVRYQERIPAEDYHALAQRFNPKRFNPREWAALARDSGMRYMVLTAKHHDGFCLFDSKFTDFTAAKTAAGRDLVGEYVQACRNEGLGIGLYFSVKDWDVPAYFRGPEQDPDGWARLVRHFHNQALELASNYGKLDILFYDCPDDANFRGGWQERTPDIWGSRELNARIRKIQPDILINNRSGLDEDYSTPENEILCTVGDMNRMYESNMTLNDNWGYTVGDNRWKNVDTLIDHLINCAARGCNYLLNVGPDPDGVIQPEAVARIREAGLWLGKYGEAVYGTERILPNWWDYCSVGRITTKGECAYVVVKYWSPNGELVFTQLKNKVLSASLLPSGSSLAVRCEEGRVVVSGLPMMPPDSHANVIKLELDGRPEPQYYY